MTYKLRFYDEIVSGYPVRTADLFAINGDMEAEAVAEAMCREGETYNYLKEEE